MANDPAQFNVGRPTKPVPKGPQFGLRALLLFTTGMCVVFGVLSALGVAYWQTLLGFGVLACFSLLVILALELGHRFVGTLNRPHRSSSRYATKRQRADAKWHLANPPDPTGIDFVAPDGISFPFEMEAEAAVDPSDEPITGDVPSDRADGE